ncbi:MAG: ferrous iron transport protein B [bacterium JZ-2024 1]
MSERCHPLEKKITGEAPIIALIGMPNVGKSVLFHRLSGVYSTVSNFPGTTIEFNSALLQLGKQTYHLVDMPGIFSLFGDGDLEKNIRNFLQTNTVETVILVTDAKNFDRSLFLLAELAHLGIRLLLVLNFWDEAQNRRISIHIDALKQRLGIPVVPAIAIRGVGVPSIIKELPNAAVPEIPPLPYMLDGPVKNLDKEWSHLPTHLRRWEVMQSIRRNPNLYNTYYSAYQIWIKEVTRGLLTRASRRFTGWQNILHHPVYGYLILGAVLLAMYEVIGVFGAGTVVDFLENQVFGEWLLPFLKRLFAPVLPPLIYDFFLGEYGMLSMAIPYSLALILPLVVLFYLSFALLEDSGYLPRIAVLLHRFFEKIGLTGRAVVPMLLGLGCVTMATLTTRILQSKREKILVTLLMALGIPCSAQLAVVFAMLAGLGPTAVFLWAGVVFLNLLLVAFISHQVFRKEPSHFLIELPPLRFPSMGNIVQKTYSRTRWYLFEVIPLFILCTAILWAMDKMRILTVFISLLSPVVVKWMLLPPETATAFLIGFFRRDYGAAGLYALQQQGILSFSGILTSVVTITLFVPCLANFLMIWKERGKEFALYATAFIFTYSFLVGGLFHRLLLWMGL